MSVKSNSLPQSRPDPNAVYDHADRFHLTEFFLRNKLQITDAEFKTIQIPGMVLCVYRRALPNDDARGADILIDWQYVCSLGWQSPKQRSGARPRPR